MSKRRSQEGEEGHGWGGGSNGVVRVCWRPKAGICLEMDGSNGVMRVRRRPEVEESLETGSTVLYKEGRGSLLHSCGKDASEPGSSKVQKNESLDK
ncbi:hypothetical protein Y032_0194g1454 [Ancylostoma ceylanicum]|uniref:Uncharacterized protein n=1 Tax=Ancylostoma ceylanicum TaxID=53326 RepID=A0A016SQ61_9BILA|nr:hypothetical protein Y032_0194g1454 [Ancylostoma ceylanicum]